MIILWGCFVSFSNSGNIEYFKDKLQIRQMGLGKTVAQSFKLLPDTLSRPTALLSSYHELILTYIPQTQK